MQQREAKAGRMGARHDGHRRAEGDRGSASIYAPTSEAHVMRTRR